MVKLSNICKTYTRGQKSFYVLKNCNLNVKKGDFLIIMGASGSGKSTLLNLIGGIDKPDSGDIIIDNTKLISMSDKDLTIFRRNNIGIIFQFFNLLPTLTSLENVAMPLLLMGEGYNKAIKKAKYYINLVNLSDKKTNHPEELSGGEMQRLAIARALISKPKLVLADEPTGNLDSKNAEDVYLLLKKLSKELNHTIIFVTHNNDLAKKANDNVTLLKDGTLYK